MSEKIRMDDVASIFGNKSHLFRLSWKMTEWCNYRCPYCYMLDKTASDNNLLEQQNQNKDNYILEKQK